MANKIFGIIGWIGTILVFAAVGARLYTPPFAWWSDSYTTYMAWAGLASVLVYMAGQWRDVANFYKGRGAQYGTMSIVSIVVFLGILIAVNYLAVRQNKRWDFTANQVYSLSDQTIRILKELKEPVSFVAFDREANFGPLRDRLNTFAYQSSKVKTEFVDPDREPARAKEAAIQSYGTIVIQYQGRTERVTSTDEQALTNGLIKVVTGVTRKVYFTQGHGEKDIADTQRGFSAIADALKSDNYSVESLVLVQQKSVPADATVLIVAGPSTDFFPTEIEALNTYVNAGGKVMVMLDPESKPGALSFPLLTQFLSDWGIRAGNDVVLDASGMGQRIGTDASVPLAAAYPAHPISENFRLVTGYPMARSMTPIEGGSGGHVAQPLVTTGPQSWSEAELGSLTGTGGTEVGFDAAKGDKMGPITLGAASSAPATAAAPAPGSSPLATPDADRKLESRVVGIGDSDFAANNGLGISGNRDFFLNAVNWLAQQENLIAIRPRQPDDRRLTLTAEQSNRIFWLCLLIIPGIVFASGIYTWWRRR